MEIKPIETIYNGYRFRSRLEARWAVFFDAMGIKYEYEHEGYEIKFEDAPIRYLPDFWLPEWGLHAEVKGCDCRGKIPKDDAFKMSWMIDYNGPCANGIILLGEIPDPKGASGIGYAVWRWDGEGLEYGYMDELPWSDHFYKIDNQCAPHWFDKNDDIELTYSFFDRYPDNYESSNVAPEDSYDFDVARALLKARQARFEHGETPTT